MNRRKFFFASAAGVAVAGAASAQLPLTGVGAGSVGGAGFPRVVPMVSLNPEIGLHWAIPADSPRIVWCASLNISYGNSSTDPTVNYNVLNRQPFGSAQAYSGSNAELTAGMCGVWDNSSGHIGEQRVNGNPAGGNPSANAAITPATGVQNATTTQLLIVGDTNYGTGLKRLGVYQNGVQVMSGWPDAGASTGAFNMNFSQALGFILNQLYISPGAVGAFFQIGDLWCHTVSTDIPSTVINSSNVVDPVLVAAFWANGSPQDTSQTKPLGLSQTSVQMVHLGPKGSFLTNVGTLTQNTQLTPNSLLTGVDDAPYNFGETDNFPFARWPTPVFKNGSTITYTNNSFSGITNNGNPIVLNDLIKITVKANNNLSGGSNYGFNLSGSTGTAYATIPNTNVNILSGARSMNMISFWKLADANDVTAAGAAWGNAPTLNWTPGSDSFNAAGAGIVVSVQVYGNVHTAAPIFNSNGVPNSSGTTGSTVVSPTATTPTGNSLAIFDWGIYNNDDPGANQWGIPNSANQNLRFKLASPGSTSNTATGVGSISGNVLTLTSGGPFFNGMTISGTGVTSCTIQLALSSTQYIVTTSQTVSAGTTITAAATANAAGAMDPCPIMTDERFTSNAGVPARTLRCTALTCRNNIVTVTVLQGGP